MTRPLFVLTLSLCAAGQMAFSSVSQADELFSRVPIDKVFTPTGPSPSPEIGPRQSIERGQKVLSISQLADLLRDAGLEPQVDEEVEKIANVRLQHARGIFEISLALTDNRDEIEMVLRLTDLDGKQLPAEKLLALLAANREHQPAVFSFSEKRKRLELWRSVTNIDISPRALREELRRLTTIAESTAGLWDIGLAAAPSPAPQQGTQPAPAPQPAPSTGQPPTANTLLSTLTGKWSAARSAKEAFAMALNADGSFVLVYVKDGKQSRSTGRFTLQGTQLSLNGSDGSKLSGTISSVTEKSFEFTPQGSSAGKLSFQKAS